MAFSASHVSNLDNSMVAAQDVQLGTRFSTLYSNYSSYKVTAGSVVQSGSQVHVTSGLASVIQAVASLSASPSQQAEWVSTASGSVAGTFYINFWTNSSASNVIPVGGSGSMIKVGWIAVGSA